MLGRYQPSFSAHFPKLGRGHGHMTKRGKVTGQLVGCLTCGRTPKAAHFDAAGNRKDWEEGVGIRRASRGAARQPAPISKH